MLSINLIFISHLLIFLGFCQFLDLFENVVLAWYLQNAGSQKFISGRWEERSKDTDQFMFSLHPFPKIGKKKKNIHKNANLFPFLLRESNDSVNSYLVPY